VNEVFERISRVSRTIVDIFVGDAELKFMLRTVMPGKKKQTACFLYQQVNAGTASP